MSGLPPIVLLTADAPSILPELGPPQWGIFDQGGQPILVSDAVGGVEYERQYDVSDYPQEQAASFLSYNKVQRPYEAQVTLLSSMTREVLLSILEPVVASLQLVSVVMPEWGYQSANLTRYQFRRTSRNGVTLIEVTVGCKEIRFANSMLSSSSSQQQQGTGGTDRPIGQVNGGSNLAGGGAGATGATGAPGATGATGGVQSAIDTGSTNAATPTQSGPVQAADPASSAGLPPPNRSFLIMGEPITNPADLPH